MTIGDRIKERRSKLGLTLEDVAKSSGVSRQTIQRYESGVISNIPSDRIEMIANALSVSPSFLMGWEDDMITESSSYYMDPDAAEMAQELYERPEMRVLFDASRKATKEDIEQVAEILKKLGGK